jgi:hypothetical protein
MMARVSLVGCILSAACAAPYADSLSPPRAEVCSVPRGWKSRAVACSRVVGTVVDAEGRPVPNAAVFYTVLDRALNPEGVLLMADADAQGQFQLNLYLPKGRPTSATTALRLGASNVSPRRVSEGRQSASPRWTGSSETVVTYVRVGGTLTVSTATIVLDYFIP